MNIKSLLGAVVLGSVMAGPGFAASIDLDFSFAGVFGTFFGLDDADGVSSASSVTFNGAFDSYLFDSSGALSNAFTFSAGALTDMAFSYTDPVIGTGVSGLLTNFDCLFDNCVTSEQTIPFGAFFEVTGSVPVFTDRPVAAIPLPAGSALLLSGLIGFVGIVGLRCRKSRAA
ncbi:hypothetical protein [uncultured Roseovarius sp.]|uniref:hypothetical protein n=1 Tax=uncultured Roseovarius sp. TaxID=293344 RepID=UPI0026206222|nr:hypothetical protein [uncultured Roseovarius sp.]